MQSVIFRLYLFVVVYPQMQQNKSESFLHLRLKKTMLIVRNYQVYILQAKTKQFYEKAKCIINVNKSTNWYVRGKHKHIKVSMHTTIYMQYPCNIQNFTNQFFKESESDTKKLSSDSCSAPQITPKTHKIVLEFFFWCWTVIRYSSNA